jgi:hypothetical protein
VVDGAAPSGQYGHGRFVSGSTGRPVRILDLRATKEGLMGTKDKGGSKSSKKAPQHNLKEKRQAKKTKKGR